MRNYHNHVLEKYLPDKKIILREKNRQNKNDCHF